MKQNNSDQNGRALEYEIVRNIISGLNAIPDKDTIADQERDHIKFDTLSDDLKSRFTKAGVAIVDWVKNRKKISKGETIKVIRLKDNAAKAGDVTDIRLEFDGDDVLNLSIKHNHSALKHQRPGALPQQLGYLKSSTESIKYREEYSKLALAFLARSKQKLPTAKLFNELKEVDGDFINIELYEPMCKLVADFLNKNGQKEFAEYFFKFLVGNINFHKIIVFGSTMEVYCYADIASPKSLKAEVHERSYVKVSFSNGWNISMRLHTASSRLAGVSLKFDTQPINISIPKSNFNL